MDSKELQARTKRFALDVIRFVETLPREQTSFILGKQLLRSATSIGANYRAACKARSRADFVSKITIVEEESDECQYWIELILESVRCDRLVAEKLHAESCELTAIFTASGRTAKAQS